MGRGRGAAACGGDCGTSTLRAGAGGAAATGVGAGLGAAAAGMGAGLGAGAARRGDTARRSSCSDAVGITTLTALDACPLPCEFDVGVCFGGSDAAAASASAGCAALSGRARPLLGGPAATLGGPRGEGAGTTIPVGATSAAGTGFGGVIAPDRTTFGPGLAEGAGDGRGAGDGPAAAAAGLATGDIATVIIEAGAGGGTAASSNTPRA